MLRNLFLLLLVLIFSNSLKAQQLVPIDQVKYVAQIKKSIQNSQQDSTRVHNYLLLSEYWAPTDSLQSRQALDKALSLNTQEFPLGVYEYYQGVFHANQGQKKTAIQHYQNAIESLVQDSTYNALLIKSYYNLAYIQVEDKGYDFMVKTLTEKCIPLSVKSNNKELLAYSYTQLGLTFMSVGQFQTAQEYHDKALEVLNQIPSSEVIHLITYLNMVSNYCYKPDSKTAEVYLKKAKYLIEDYPTSQHYTNYYYQQAMYYTTIQDFEKAFISLHKGAELAKQNQQGKLLHMIYFRMYNIYLMQKDYPKAKQVLEHILQENILVKEPGNRRITYTQLAAVNDILQNHKQAYDWLKKSSALSDSLTQQKLLEKMHELEIVHQTAQSEQTIASLQQAQKENELISKNNKLRITFLGIALGLSLIIAALIYLTYKKQKKINAQIKLAHQQDLLHIENQQRYEATKAVLQGEEQERHRIAQDLHDSMGGMLANIRMTISQENNPNSDLLIQKIDKCIGEMRRISRNLMPETLKNLGLEIALKELTESMTQKNFHIQFEAFGLSDTIPFKIQISMYRIVQESISNVIKYAQATNVIVQVSQHQNVLTLTIEDDGIGFDTRTVVYGLGIKNIENRAALLNGTLEIISEKGKGTTIYLECYA